MAEQPTAPPPSGAFHRSASICTHRRSISAVWGYSSLSIMFLLMHRSISWWTSGLLPGLAERGQVLAGVAVEQQLVGDGLEGVVGSHLVVGEAVGRQGGQQVLAGVDRVEQLVTGGHVLVQGHGAQLFVVWTAGRSSGSDRWIVGAARRRAVAATAGDRQTPLMAWTWSAAMARVRASKSCSFWSA